MLDVHGAAQAHHVVGAVAAGDAVPARVVAPVEIELFGGLQGGLHRDVLCFGPPLQGEGWVGMGLTFGVRVIWVDRGVVWHSGGGRETHPHPGPPLEGEGESHGNRSYAGNVRNSCSSSACVSRSSTPIASLIRSEEQTSELQSLMRISSAVF